METFEFAMKLENETEAYYRNLAAKAENKGVKDILSWLAEEERKHYEVLSQMRRKVIPRLQDTRLLRNVKEVFKKMKEDVGGFEFSASQIELYQKAQELERKSRGFYLEHAAQVSDKKQKELFLKLAEEERKHYRVLEHIIDFVRRPQSWLENSEFYHLDEY
jgi:rubrerythrin